MGKPVGSNEPLMASGLDSLAAIEFKNSVSTQFGVVLPATLAFDYPTLEVLAGFVASSRKSSRQEKHGRITFRKSNMLPLLS